MATIIPNIPPGNDPAHNDVHRCLTQLAGKETLSVRQALSPLPGTSVCYWIQSQRRKTLLALPDTSRLTDVDALDTHSLTSVTAELIKQRNALLPQALQTHAHHLIPIILFCPDHLESRQTLQLREQGLIAVGTVLLEGALPVILARQPGVAASASALCHIHSRFLPDSRLSHSDSKMPVIMSEPQEQALYNGLFTQNRLATHHHQSVTGIAGSGKTQVIINRAALLIKRCPDQRVLILSFNKAINNIIRTGINNLTHLPNGLECYTFNDWARKRLGGTGVFVQPDEELALFDLMMTRHFEDIDLSRFGLMREISFIKDRMIKTETEYMNTLRSQDSLALSAPVRKKIWQAMIDVDTHLKDQNKRLWGDLPAILLEKLENDTVSQGYQHILIDEAHYFASSWFTVLKSVLAPKGQFFLSVDPDQDFQNSGLSWQETGLKLGEAPRLPENHRNLPGIKRLTDAFRTHRESHAIKHPLYSINHAEPITEADLPVLLHFPCEEDQQHRLFSEINTLINNGYHPGDILILNANKQSTRFLAQEIRDNLHIRAVTLTGAMQSDDPGVIKLCDLDAATGLESRVVFIAGLETLFNQEQELWNSKRELKALQKQHTRLMHVAITRARERLYLLITTRHVPEDLLLEELHKPTLARRPLAPVMQLNVL